MNLPYLIFIYLLSLFVIALATTPSFRDDVKQLFQAIPKNWKLTTVTLFAFFLSASPVIYSYFKFRNIMGSATRRLDQLAAKSLGEFVQTTIGGSINPWNFQNYLDLNGPRMDMPPLFENFLFISGVLGISLIIFLLRKFPNKRFQLITIVWLAALTMGGYFFAPHLFWWIVPGIGMFRWWSHFVAFLNLHLLFLVLIVAVKLTPKWKIPYLALAVITSFAWGVEAMKATKSSAVTDPGIVFDLHPLLERNRDALVNPRQVNLTSLYNEHPPFPYGAQIYWVILNKEEFPIRSSDVEYKITPEGVRLKLLRHQFMKSIRLMQFNDTQWQVTENGKRVEPLTNYQSEMLELPVNQQPKEYLLNRPATLWNKLIYLMWLPMLFSIFYAYPIRFPQRSARMVPAEGV